LGAAPDDLAERLHGLVELPHVHLLDADGEQSIDVGVARAAPDLPHGAPGERADRGIGIAQRAGQRRQVGHDAGVGQRAHGLAPRGDVVRAAELAERTIVGRLRGGRRDGGQDEQAGQRECPHGVYTSLAAVGAKPGWVAPPGRYTRPPITAAPMPWRGVGIGSLAIQRLPTVSYISWALLAPSEAPPSACRRPSSTATASPPRAVGIGARASHLSRAATNSYTLSRGVHCTRPPV